MAKIYEIELPDGRIAEIEGDRQPTEKEVRDYFNIPSTEKGMVETAVDSAKEFINEATDLASTAFSTDQTKYYIESKKGEDQKNQELMDVVNKQLTGAAPAPSKKGDVNTFGDALLVSGEQIKDIVGPPALRYGIPIGAAIVTGGGSGAATLAARMIFTGIGGQVGEDAARVIEKRQPMSGREGITTFVANSLLTPLKQYAGAANTVMGGSLEGLGFGSMPAAEEGRMPTKRELAVGGFLGLLGRGIEGRVLNSVERLNAQTAQAIQTERDIIADRNAQARTQLQEQLQAQDAYAEQIARTSPPASPAMVSAETLVPEGPLVPAKSAKSSAEVFTQLSERDQKIADFNAARAEEANVALKNELELNQVGSGQSTIFETPEMAQRARLDVDLGPGSGATRERTRLLNQADVAEPTVAGKAFERQQGQLSRMSMSAQANRMNQEYGKIDPAIMIGIGRTAVGAVGGQYFGDDPEEKIGYGLLGALAGFSAGRLINKVFGGAVKRAQMSKNGNHNWIESIAIKPFVDILRGSTDDAKALLVPAKFAARQLNDSLNLYTNSEGRQQANRYVYEFLTKQRELKDVPRNLQVASQNARDAIDGLSDELVSRGVVSGELKETLLSNRESYLRRAFRVFNEPGFRPSSEVFDNWVKAHAADEFKMPKNTKTLPELTQEYTNEANNLLTVDNAKNFVFSGRLPRADKGIFMQRDPNLSVLTRQLLGEISDPLILLNDTVPRMARTAATFQMKKEIAAIGEHLKIFTKNSDSTVHTALLTKPDNLNPLSGLYSTPEIKIALDSYTNETTSDLVKFFGSISSVTKIPKTLGSINAYATNVVGGAMDLLGQGHATQLLIDSNRKMAWDAMRTSFGLVDSTGRLKGNKTIKLYQDLVREGMIGKSITGQDFAKAFEESAFYKANTSGSNAIDFLGKLYSTPETAAKLFNLNGEIKTLRQAYGTKFTEEEIFKLAAAKVRQTTTYYEALDPLIRKASQVGFLGPFVSYTADRYRIVYNTYKIGAAELRSGNPALMKAGASRIAATTLMIGGAATLGANLHVPEGMRDALRSKVKAYDKSGLIVMNAPDKDGNFSYSNLNYLIPSSVVLEAAMSAARGDSPREAMQNFASVLGQQFLGSPLWLKPAQDIFNNEKYGKPVYSEMDSLVFSDKPFSGERTLLGDTGKYLINELVVPSTANKIKNMLDAKDGTVTRPSGRIVSVENELMSLAGLRVTTLNLPTATLAEAKVFANDNRDIGSLHAKDQDVALTDKDKAVAYNNFERRYQKVFTNVSEWVDNSKKLGMSNNDLASIGSDAKLPSNLLLGAIDGIYVPPPVEKKISASEQIVKYVEQGLTKPQIFDQIKKQIKLNPMQGEALANAFKSNIIETIRNASPTDKLLLGYDSPDGSKAGYITQQLQKMQERDGQALTHGYLKGLIRKGVVNEIDLYYLKSKHGITVNP